MPYENPQATPMALTGDRSAASLLTWLEQLRFAVQTTQWFHAALMGAAEGTDGVWAHGSVMLDVGKVTANTIPNMSVEIQPFAGVVAGVPFRIPSGIVTSPLTAPSSSPRIDALVARAAVGQDGQFVLIQGAEAGSPSAPGIEDTDVLLAWIHHRVGETSIEDADDATNGWIEDKRTPLNF